MYKEILRSVAGIGVFPAISLLLFFTVFTVMLVRVLRMDRGHATRLAGIPLIGTDAGADGEGGIR
jgi:cytochrome c oxidase cbb3-type subunit 3